MIKPRVNDIDDVFLARNLLTEIKMVYAVHDVDEYVDLRRVLFQLSLLNMEICVAESVQLRT